MFVQATKSRRNGKTYVTYLVRESFRTPDGPRSRTVCNISKLPDDVRKLVAESLSGRTFVEAEAIELEHALDCGGLAVLVEAWRTMGLIFPRKSVEGLFLHSGLWLWGDSKSSGDL